MCRVSYSLSFPSLGLLICVCAASATRMEFRSQKKSHCELSVRVENVFWKKTKDLNDDLIRHRPDCRINCASIACSHENGAAQKKRQNRFHSPWPRVQSAAKTSLITGSERSSVVSTEKATDYSGRIVHATPTSPEHGRDSLTPIIGDSGT